MKRILWFRRDLRVKDNPLLSFEGEVFPIFIFDTNILDALDADDKRVGMIYGFVQELKKNLQEIGLDLKVFYAKPLEVFNSLNLSDFDEVVASGDYDSYAKQRDIDVSQLIHFRYINDTYFLKPRELLKSDGSPYLVFTPFYKKARLLLNDKDMTPYHLAKCTLYPYDYADDFKLKGFESFDEQTTSASKKLELFRAKLKDYKDKRDYLDEDASSRLSVDLRFGLISLREVYTQVVHLDGGEDFIRQLLFREFYAYLLFHFPELEMQNYKGKFNGVEDKEKFKRFTSASTGVPIVDAGVRELLQTGNMHNRVRMVVASFFTKDLLLPWQWGERFFASHLNDYDAASNILSWQWSAGTGIDPQPYFRVFNPYLQSKKFDKDAHYIKKYIPELKDIDAKYLHQEEYLLKNKIIRYPKPILEHKIAAKIAIQNFKN